MDLATVDNWYTQYPLASHTHTHTHTTKWPSVTDPPSTYHQHHHVYTLQWDRTTMDQWWNTLICPQITFTTNRSPIICSHAHWSSHVFPVNHPHTHTTHPHGKNRTSHVHSHLTHIGWTECRDEQGSWCAHSAHDEYGFSVRDCIRCCVGRRWWNGLVLCSIGR